MSATLVETKRWQIPRWNSWSEIEPEHLMMIMRLVTPEGNIIISQFVDDEKKPYVIIHGIQSSLTYEHQGIRVIDVVVLSSGQQKRYQQQIKEKTKGPLNFWEGDCRYAQISH
ncbi:MAG: hypothetical protein Q7T49_00255 [bacterium]|nr:hypothetical protein [bacterium]